MVVYEYPGATYAECACNRTVTELKYGKRFIKHIAKVSSKSILPLYRIKCKKSYLLINFFYEFRICKRK